MKDTIESLVEQEKELERLIAGTPPPNDTKKDGAAEPKVATEETPADGKEPVTPTPKPVTDEQPKVQTEDWEKRYKNLRAGRDEKLYTAKNQLSAALSTINTLQSQVDQLRTAVPKVDPLQGVFTEKDTEDLGDATIDAMKRVTQKVTEAATKPLQAQLDEERKLRKIQNERQATDARVDAYQSFLGRVARAVPDWEKINYDENFIKWMDGADIDGTPRKTYFAQADAQGNAALVIRYMNEFKAHQATKVDPLADKITPTGENAGAAQNLEKKTGPKLISRAYINKFYDDLNRGKYKGRYSEAQALEAEIDKATQEGRIAA